MGEAEGRWGRGDLILYINYIIYKYISFVYICTLYIVYVQIIASPESLYMGYPGKKQRWWLSIKYLQNIYSAVWYKISSHTWDSCC